MRTIHAKQALTESGWLSDVAIGLSDDGRIDSVSPGAEMPSNAVDILLPSPTNLHSHSFQRAMAGLTETRGPDPSDSFWTWRKLMYRFLDRLTPDDIEAIARLAFVEMAEAGFASVAEFHYLHHAPGGVAYVNLAETAVRIVTAAETVGIGLTLLPVLYQQGGCDGRALTGGQMRFGNDLDRYAKLYEAAASSVDGSVRDACIGVAPHSLRAVDGAGLAAAAEIKGSGPYHLHLAEQVAEVDEVLAHYGARPAEWLLNNHPVDPTWCAIHATQMNSAETVALAKSGAVAGLCPITESNLGDGIFNGTDFVNSGGQFGVGSDSNIHIALFEELKVLEYSQRLRDRSRAALATREQSTGRVLFESASRGGAQAAGRNSGALAPGYLADLIAVEADNPWVCNRRGDASLDSLIFCGHGHQCITDVWSAGRHIVRNGRHEMREAATSAFLNVLNRLGQEI